MDLDAHQGKGHARDFYGDPDAYILDVYNADIYPQVRLSSTQCRGLGFGVKCRVFRV